MENFNSLQLPGSDDSSEWGEDGEDADWNGAQDDDDDTAEESSKRAEAGDEEQAESAEPAAKRLRPD